MSQTRGIFLAMILTACEAAPGPSSTPMENTDAQASENAKPSEENTFGAAKVEDASYVQSSHSLALKISYSGCKKVAHDLKMKVCAESYPLQCGAEIAHRSDPGACKQYITEEMTVTLEKTLTEAYIRFAGGAEVQVTQKSSEVSP